MDGLYRAPKPQNIVLRGTIDCDDIATMITDDKQLLNVLVFSTSLTVHAMLALQLLRHSGVTNRGFARAAEVRAIQGKEGAMSQTFSDKGTKSALLLDNYEGLEGTKLPMGGGGRMRQCDWSLNDFVVIRVVLSWLCKVRREVGSG